MPKWKLLPLSAGLLLMLLGLIAIIRPGWVAGTLAMLLGLALLLVGIIGFIFGLTTDAITPRPLFALLQSLLCTVMGIILIFNPVATLVFLAISFSIWVLLSGLAMIWQAYTRFRQKRVWLWSGIGGGVITIFALIVLFSPMAAVSAFALLAGIYLMICGIGLSLTLRML